MSYAPFRQHFRSETRLFHLVLCTRYFFTPFRLLETCFQNKFLFHLLSSCAKQNSTFAKQEHTLQNVHWSRCNVYCVSVHRVCSYFESNFWLSESKPINQLVSKQAFVSYWKFCLNGATHVTFSLSFFLINHHFWIPIASTSMISASGTILARDPGRPAIN